MQKTMPISGPSKYDRLLENVFALQDEITMCVVGAIEPTIRRAELDRVKRQRPDTSRQDKAAADRLAQAAGHTDAFSARLKKGQ
jgi:hypothetical protein